MGALAQPPHEKVAKVLIVDDHPAAREGLASRISSQSGLQVCGEAGDLFGALQLVSATSPDVVVVDVVLKDESGIELIKRIRERTTSTRVLVWSVYKESVYAERALRAGASGYIQKEQPTEKIVAAIRHVLTGGVYLSPQMTEVILRQAAGGIAKGVGADPIDQLSDRELEVFRLIGLGLDVRQIAERLHLSRKTVETYRGRLKTKLGVTTVTEVIRLALLWAMKNG